MTETALLTFERLFGPEFGHGKPFDLARLRTALAALGDPQNNLPPIVHVAGANGKGSTIAFLRAIAEAAGCKVHAFTKPHLFRLNERFLVAGAIASNDMLIAAANEIARAAPALTQFDAQVAAAFLLFERNPAQLVLLETGMGGRDDSTNVIEHPALTLITPIALDHQDALGPTLAQIAVHKAGILKRGAPAIIARQPPQASEIIEARASELSAPLHRQGVEWDAYAHAGRLVVQTESRALDLPLPSLYGAHQVDNAGLACAGFLASNQFTFDDATYAAGIAGAQWPARLQPLTRGRFSAPIRAIGGEVWVDAGHNAHAAAALAQALRAMQRKREAPSIAIIGMLARKQSDSFLAALVGAVDRVIAVPLPEPHIATALITAQAHAFDIAADAAPSLQAAMQDAAQLSAPRVLICGSFVLAAEALGLESARP